MLPERLEQVDRLITHVFPAQEFVQAFDTLANPECGAGKVIFTF